MSGLFRESWSPGGNAATNEMLLEADKEGNIDIKIHAGFRSPTSTPQLTWILRDVAHNPL